MGNPKVAATKTKKTASPRTKKKVAEAAKPKPKKTTRSARPKAIATVAPAQEEIALRAYFISEERQRKGLPGSHEDDWIEAERQLNAHN